MYAAYILNLRICERGRMYREEKQAVGAPKGNANAEKQLDHESQKSDPIVSTAETIAKRFDT